MTTPPSGAVLVSRCTVHASSAGTRHHTTSSDQQSRKQPHTRSLYQLSWSVRCRSMKHKELLAPPSPHEPAPTASGTHQQRKKPHMLPPLADKRKNSVEWLPRGSPPPSWRRPSLEDGQLGEERADRPAVRVSRCSEAPEEAAVARTSGGLRTPKYAPLEPIKRKTTP